MAQRIPLQGRAGPLSLRVSLAAAAQANSLQAEVRETVMAVDQLTVTYRAVKEVLQLSEVDDDTVHERRREAWQKFISKIEATATKLNVPVADRNYRQYFTENYQALFPTTARHYRWDILDSSAERQPQVWANGTAYDVSAATLDMAQDLQVKMANLCFLCVGNYAARALEAPRLTTMLAELDVAWASYEKNYICELEVIEAQARSFLTNAADTEAKLHKMEVSKDLARGPSETGDQLGTPCRSDERGDVKRLAECSEDASSSLSLSATLSLSLSLRGRDRRSTSLSMSLPSSSLDWRRRNPSFAAEMQVELPALMQTGVWSSQGGRSKEGEVRRLAASAAPGATAERRELLKQLMDQVSLLNSRANITGHGRSDMGIEVIEAASEALRCTDASEGSSAALAARRLLGRRVLTAFASLRSYMAEACVKPSRLDPQLCNNRVLVQRLYEWEENWELGSRYLLETPLLSALCGVAALAAEAQTFAPRLKALCEDQDAELFLVLPRLVWLATLVKPEEYAALPASFLPHRFAQGTWSDENSRRLLASFEQTALVLNRGESVKSCSGPAWEALVLKAVDSEPMDFTRILEGFSMELQRHMPEDWNRCCSLLLECVGAASNRV